MNRRRLTRIHRQQLLRVALRVLVRHRQIAVADREKAEAAAPEIPQTEVRDIPAQLVVADLIVSVSPVRPLLRRPFAERREMEALLMNQLLHVPDHPVNLRTFHRFSPRKSAIPVQHSHRYYYCIVKGRAAQYPRRFFAGDFVIFSEKADRGSNGLGTAFIGPDGHGLSLRGLRPGAPPLPRATLHGPHISCFPNPRSRL